jgi:hypothetical protein
MGKELSAQQLVNILGAEAADNALALLGTSDPTAQPTGLGDVHVMDLISLFNMLSSPTKGWIALKEVRHTCGDSSPS